MQIAEVVALPPACCAICKSGNAEEKHPFVDTQAHYPQGQRVDRIYICFNCVKTLGNLHGFISPEEAEVKDHQIEALQADVAHLEAKNKAFNDIQAALDVFNPPAEPETELPDPEPEPEEPIETGDDGESKEGNEVLGPEDVPQPEEPAPPKKKPGPKPKAAKAE